MSHSRSVGKLLALVSLFALLTFTMSAFGQGSQASVAGVVRDASGAVIPGATVTLTNAGTNQVLTTTSSAEGTYVFPLISNGKYVVTAEKEGFQKATYRDVEVLPAKQYSLNVTMQVGSKSETVEVTAGQDLINTASSEIAGSVDQKQILNLPLLGRNPIELIRTQAGTPGILDATRNTTTINGARPGWTQTSQDGININDNFIRNNANDFVPNRPTSDTVAEFSIITNNVGADSTAGTSQVKLATPSGTNAFHGSVYEYNRNSALAANDYFNKHTDNPDDVIPKDFLNQNQFGGRLGGRIIKDKLFFFTSYEGYRLRQQTTASNIVPMDDKYLTGQFKLGTTGKTIPDVLALVNKYYTNVANGHTNFAGLSPLSINPEVQKTILDRVKGASLANRTTCGNNYNTTCYTFQQANPTDRNQEVGRFDYNMNSKHSFEFVFQRFTDLDARTDIDNINTMPLSTLSTNTKLFVGAWRWIATPTVVNEVRVGDNHSIVPFLTGRTADPSYFFAPGSTNNNAPTLSALGLTSPDYYFMPQGRDVTTRQYIDNGTWTKGAHTIAFGGSMTYIAPHTYNYANTVPTITMGFTGANTAYALLTADFTAEGYTGLSSSMRNAVNNYAAFLAGAISQASQTFQAKDINSGFVAGYPNKRAYQYNIWSPYVQDTWRLKSNLTVIAGLKYEYWTPLKELNNLGLTAVPPGSYDAQSALLDPNGKIYPMKGYAWKPDRTQFAPNVGFAWDPFKNGKTSIRGGYSLAYVNEDMVTAGNNALGGNPGLNASKANTNLSLILNGPPTVDVPTFDPNRTFVQQMATFGNTTAAYAIQPDMRTPYAHQLSFEIQREVPFNTAIYARYVGTLGRDLWRGVDYNQQKSASNPAFLADFNRARFNALNCFDANNNPLPYGEGCAVAQPLQWFPSFNLAGNLNDPNNLYYLQTGQIGELANQYVINPGKYPNARATFLPNPSIYVADELKNGAVSSYHALQLEARRAMKNGLQFQINYTFSKLLSNAAGNSQARFEPYMDNSNPRLDYGRSEYDLNHVINSNFVWELPVGRGKKFFSNANGIVDRVVGGWSMSSIIRWQSGNPFTIQSRDYFTGSGYGTYNRQGRMTGATAYTTLTPDQIKKLLGIYMDKETGTIYWINPSVIDKDSGTATGYFDTMSYTPQFQGQAFYHPLPGQWGNMRRLAFNGPSAFTWDFSAAKTTRITERVNTEFRADFFNFLNRTNFALYGDYNIDSPTFGQIDSTLPNRIIQMSLRVSF